jgi:hypothetical protein
VGLDPQVDGNLEAAEEVLVRGLRVDPLSVAMNYAHGLLLRDGKRRRDQAKDSFEWVAQQEGGRDNADAVLAAGAVCVCSRMLAYAHVRSRMLTYAHVCSRILAHVCSRISLLPAVLAAGAVCVC